MANNKVNHVEADLVLASNEETSSEELRRLFKNSKSPRVKKQILRNPNATSDLLVQGCRLYPEEIVDSPAFDLYELFGDSEDDKLLKLIKEIHSDPSYFLLVKRHHLCDEIRKIKSCTYRESREYCKSIETIALASPKLNYGTVENIIESSDPYSGPNYLLERMIKNKVIRKKVEPHISKFKEKFTDYKKPYNYSFKKICYWFNVGLINTEETVNLLNADPKHINYLALRLKPYSGKSFDSRLIQEGFNILKSFDKQLNDLYIRNNSERTLDKTKEIFNIASGYLGGISDYDKEEASKNLLIKLAQNYSETLVSNKNYCQPSSSSPYYYQLYSSSSSHSYYDVLSAVNKIKYQLGLKRTTDQDKENFFAIFVKCMEGSNSYASDVKRMFPYVLGFKTDKDSVGTYEQYLDFIIQSIDKVADKVVIASLLSLEFQHALYTTYSKIRYDYKLRSAITDNHDKTLEDIKDLVSAKSYPRLEKMFNIIDYWVLTQRKFIESIEASS
jgi:hypothetical protein